MRRLLLMLSLLLLSPLAPGATSVTFEWDASVGATGYTIHCGNASGDYAAPVDVGNVTQAVVQLPSGKSYFCAAKAYDGNGPSSNYSSCTGNGFAACTGGELIFHIKPETPTNIRIGP